MASPFPLQTAYIGMQQDSPRDLLPNGALWNCVDFIPVFLGAPLRKRGGWSYASQALGSTTYVDALIYAPFVTPLALAVGSDGHLYKFAVGSNTDVGTAFAVAQNPIYHRSNSTGLVIIPAASGTTTPKSYDGTTFQDLAGTPPKAIYGAVWNDRALLSNGTVGGTLFPQRTWFGPVGNSAGTWDTTNAWQDQSLPNVGIAVLRNAILFFHARSTERIKGTTPPSATTVGDLVQDFAFDVGCIDARSIVKYNDTVIWADVRGVYQSDGAALKDLTATAGMTSYWTTMLSAYAAGYTVAAGIYHDTYIVSVMNGTSFVDCLCYDLPRGFWYRLSNFPARCFARISSTSEETFMGLANAGRVASLSSIMAPVAGVKNDANGTAVQPYFETGLYRGFERFHRKWISSHALQSWRRGYLNYDLRDAAADAPILTISYAIDPGASSYTAISRTLAATTKYTRLHRDLYFQGSGLMLKIAQTNASSDTRIHAIEAEYSPVEASRLAQ